MEERKKEREKKREREREREKERGLNKSHSTLLKREKKIPKYLWK